MAPFVSQVANPSDAVLAPHAPSSPFERDQGLLSTRGYVLLHGHERSDSAAVLGNDRRASFFCGFEKIWKLIADLFGTLADYSF